MDNNLPELRDIHLPNGVSIWPPAYGWWVILAIIIVAALLFWLAKWLRRKSKKLYALRMLRNINGENNITAALEMSAILRRICVYKYKQAVVLMGEEWVNFLNQHCKKKLEGRAAKLLLEAPYMHTESKTYKLSDVQALSNFCQSWIGDNL